MTLHDHAAHLARCAARARALGLPWAHVLEAQARVLRAAPGVLGVVRLAHGVAR